MSILPKGSSPAENSRPQDKMWVIKKDGRLVSRPYESQDEAKEAMWKLADAKEDKGNYIGSTRYSSGCEQALLMRGGGKVVYSVSYRE